MKWRLLVYSYGLVQREVDFTALTGLNSAEENQKDSLYSKGKFPMGDGFVSLFSLTWLIPWRETAHTTL